MRKFLTKDNLNRTTEAPAYEAADFISSFSGAQAPVKTNSNGTLDPSLVPSANSAKEIAAEIVLGETIPALSLVFIGPDEKAYLATRSGTYTQAGVVGISLESGTAGQTKRFLVFGRLDDASFTYPVGTELYLGVAGAITSTAPTTGHHKPIGQALRPGSIFFKVGTTTIL